MKAANYLVQYYNGSQWVWVSRPKRFWEPRVWGPSKQHRAQAFANTFSRESGLRFRVLRTDRRANQ
jgi:hypothetical protein